MTLVTTIVAMSLGSVKVYPFAPPNFFLASVRQYCSYTIAAPNGQALALHEFGLGDFYTGQGGSFDRMPWQEQGAVKLPASSNIHGVVLSREQVAALVQHALRRRPAWPYVIVSQRVIAALDQQRVGLVATHRWLISSSTVVTESEAPGMHSPQQGVP